jgi:hypothetical protein
MDKGGIQIGHLDHGYLPYPTTMRKVIQDWSIRRADTNKLLSVRFFLVYSTNTFELKVSGHLHVCNQRAKDLFPALLFF